MDTKDMDKLIPGLEPSDIGFLKHELCDVDMENLGLDSMDWTDKFTGEEVLDPHISDIGTVPIHLLFPDLEKLEFRGFIAVNVLTQECEEKLAVLNKIVDNAYVELQALELELLIEQLGNNADGAKVKRKLSVESKRLKIDALVGLPIPGLVHCAGTFTRGNAAQLGFSSEPTLSRKKRPTYYSYY